MTRKTSTPILALAALVFTPVLVSAAHSAFADQTAAVRKSPSSTAAGPCSCSTRVGIGPRKRSIGRSSDLPPWRIDPKSLPPWLSVAVTGSGKSRTFVNTVMTAGLKKGPYHAVVRADNVEPISGRPMSALYYDVDLEVAHDDRRASR